VAVEVRPCEPAEVLDGLAPIWHYFGRVPTEESTRVVSPVLPPGRLHAAFDNGRVVGGAGAFTFELTVPGGRVPAAGVTVVGVLPTHRRRGVLRQMMRTQLDDVRERGEPVAYLWASEATIYGRYGYGMASLAGEFELQRSRATFAEPFAPAGTVRLLSHDEARALLPQVYDSIAAATPGMFARTTAWWDARVLADPEWRRGGGGELVRALLDVDGTPAAYALYRLHPGFEYSISTGAVAVIEALGTTPAATREIWRYLFDIDWMDRVRARLLPVDHPLFFLLAEPRRMRFTVADALWVRLVDVGAALSARSYEDGEPVVLELSDAFCPWNEGRWRVSAEGAERTEDESDLRLDVSAVASVYLGGFTFAELARGGRVEELSNGALGRADRLFYTHLAPWCPEIF
jgi:predicted acetyltransferase